MNPFLLRFEQFESANKTETPKPGTEEAEEDGFGIYGTTNGLGDLNRGTLVTEIRRETRDDN